MNRNTSKTAEQPLQQIKKNGKPVGVYSDNMYYIANVFSVKNNNVQGSIDGAIGH